jgi:Protein of unknown function (DUF1604).
VAYQLPLLHYRNLHVLHHHSDLIIISHHLLYKDELPRKKPASLNDQVATDKYGRRRFHGAFTGGFSAGFFNSVGSLEGWTPSTFKSSRSDKAKGIQQKPEDFMDDEVTV